MTTEYPTKENAILWGCFYATGKHEKPESFKAIKGDVSQFGKLANAELYEMINSKGAKAIIGVSEFRDGWDLWLIDPDSGMCMRA